MKNAFIIALAVLSFGFIHHKMIARATGSTASPLSVNQFSLELAGGNGYALIGPGGSVPSDMNVNPLSDSYSAHVWVKLASGTLPNEFCIFSRARANSSSQALFLGLSTNGRPYLYIGDFAINATTAINDGAWHSVGLAVGGGTFGLVVDGVIEATGSSGSNNSTFDYLIGASRYDTNFDDSFAFIGLIQNLTWWTAKLNASDFLALHGGGVPVDPTTHTKHASLAHWWPLGQDQTFPTFTASTGATNATAINTFNTRLTKHSPVFTPSALAVLSGPTGGTGITAHFVADDWTAGTNWTERVIGTVAVRVSTPAKSASAFAGRSKISNAGWFRVPNDTPNLITTSTKVSYVFVMYTGALNSSGGFFMGYDATVYGKSNVEIYNFGYVRDVGFRIRRDDNTGDYLAAESGEATHANKYVILAVTVDMTVPRIRTYVLGGLLAEDTSTSGAYSNHTSAPWGILGIAYSDAGGYVSTASGQEIVEVARIGRELSANDVALLSAEFNALKGYY
jgi:hypothetical protein